jgi:hypothetical protein
MLERLPEKGHYAILTVNLIMHAGDSAEVRLLGELRRVKQVKTA